MVCGWSEDQAWSVDGRRMGTPRWCISHRVSWETEQKHKVACHTTFSTASTQSTPLTVLCAVSVGDQVLDRLIRHVGRCRLSGRAIWT